MTSDKAIRCIVCRELEPDYTCRLYVRHGDTFREVVCGAHYHGGDCLRAHLAECGLTGEAAERVNYFRTRAARARRRWHGSAGGSPGL